MIPNPIRKVLSVFRKHQVRVLLMGGQACVFYGAAQFSRDVDFEGETWEVLNVEDLVRAKKTQRDKDWPMIRALVEAHFVRHRVQPQPHDVRFWFRESRSPEILRQCAAAYPDLCVPH